MRRSLLAIPILGTAAVIGVFAVQSGTTPAQPPNGMRPSVEAAVPRPAASSLPISQVVLFSSGVGYFQREGEVEGNARVDLTFPVDNINDLLKSMVLQDLGGGQVSSVSYDSHDPIEKTLRSFAINLTENPSFGQVLNQARGERIEVVLQQTNVTQPGTMTGTVMGIEAQQQPAGKDGAITVEFLNLWCAEGLRSIKLSEVQRVRFLNPVLETELKRALEVLALSHDTQKKAVSLGFSGEGKRPVRVSYVVESPIWKTSYRLVLDKQGKLFLQGWAVVENTTDDDWNNVRMGLVAGRPISFQMDLYQPLYVPRPTVEPELFASLRPVTYGGDMLAKNGVRRDLAEQEDRQAGARRLNRATMDDASKRFESAAGESLAIRPAPAAGFGYIAGADVRLRDKGLQQGVVSAATATEMGNFFQYVINHPVSLARQKSAMLPIVNEPVEGTKVSIYNQATHAKFPLHGLKFRNTTGLHLMQGPMTVFEGGTYAGDARVTDLQPKEERLLSYAIDLGTEVEPVVEHAPQRLIAVKIFKGIIQATNKMRESKMYNVTNRSEHDRQVIIEHPFRQDFTLVTPEKPSERSRDVYRFELNVPAGKAAQQKVVEERDVMQQISLNNTDEQAVRVFLNSEITSPKVKEVLTQAMALKSKLALLQRDVADRTRELQEITKDQERLRANLREMPATAAAYKRYLEKFDKQETEIEKLQGELKMLREQELKQKKEYDTYLASLTVE